MSGGTAAAAQPSGSSTNRNWADLMGASNWGDLLSAAHNLLERGVEVETTRTMTLSGKSNDDVVAAVAQAWAGGPAKWVDDDLAAERSLHQRLMASGHERPEVDACTICLDFIPLPMDENSKTNECCMKRVCNGCIWAARERPEECLRILQDALHERQCITARNGSETRRQGRRGSNL